MRFKSLFVVILLLSCSRLLNAQYFSKYDINNDSAGGFPQNITNFQGVLFMSALVDSGAIGYYGTQLGIYNGQVYEPLILNSMGSSDPQGFTAFNNNLYFQAYNYYSGAQLWVIYSSTGIVKMLTDVGPLGIGSYPNSFTVCDSLLFFVADDSTHGYELWVTDGDSANTHLVKDIFPGPSGSYPQYLTVLNNKLYFQANDSVHGPELWVSDGTSAGTFMLQDINAADTTGSFPAYLTVFGDSIFFQANNGINGFTLWCTDGTQLGTIPVSTACANPQNFTVYNGLLCFQAFDTAHGAELWATDGTTDNTQLVMDIFPGDSSSNPQNFMVYNNRLYFQANDGQHGAELWVTDGTSPGTIMVDDIYPGPAGSYPEFMIPYSGKLFFVANDSASGWEMFSSDGTPTGTNKIVPYDSAYSSPLAFTGGFTLFNNDLAFSAEYDSTGQELWFYGPEVLAIPNITPADNITAYPNPFGANINVTGLETGKDYTLRLLDMMGREVFQQEVEAAGRAYSLYLPEIPDAIYLLQIRSGENFTCKKLVRASGQ